MLARYAEERDEAAFELLVWRHAALVAGVCQRVLRDSHRAEDAFQAAFFVLARQAGSIRGNLAGWLFRVARRIAVRAKQSADRTARREMPLGAEPCREPPPPVIEQFETAAILDEEIAHLPERLRLPVLLCYLGGSTTEEAAKALGCPRGTILSRLATARCRLAASLSRRGVAIPAAGFLTTLALPTPAALARLIPSVVRQSLAFRLGKLLPVADSPSQLLAQGVIATMKTNRLLAAASAVLLSTGLVAGVGLMTVQAGPEAAGVPLQPAAKAEPPKADPPRPEPPAKKDIREERIKKLEMIAGPYRARLTALEDLIALFSPKVEEHKRAQSRIDKLDAELSSVRREIVELEVGIAVIKKRIAEGRFHIKEKFIRSWTTPQLENAQLRGTEVKRLLQTAEQANADKKAPEIEKLRKELQKAEEEIKAARNQRREQAEAVFNAESKELALEQIDDLEDKLEIKKATLDVLTKLREQTKREAAESAAAARNLPFNLRNAEIARATSRSESAYFPGDAAGQRADPAGLRRSETGPDPDRAPRTSPRTEGTPTTDEAVKRGSVTPRP